MTVAGVARLATTDCVLGLREAAASAGAGGACAVVGAADAETVAHRIAAVIAQLDDRAALGDRDGSPTLARP